MTEEEQAAQIVKLQAELDHVKGINDVLVDELEFVSEENSFLRGELRSMRGYAEDD